MMWLMRAGQKAKYFELFMREESIFLPWDGFRSSLKNYTTLNDLRHFTEMEKGIKNTTSVSNWAGQLNYFSNEMQIGDWILIPEKFSRKYVLAKIAGEYIFCKDSELCHSRKINIIVKNISRDIFPQSVQYSLGAFRTLFKVRTEQEVLSIVEKLSID